MYINIIKLCKERIMKKVKLFIFAILVCLLGMFAVACGKNIDFDYNIDFIVDGEVVATVGTDGDKISMPKNPTKEDYKFEGWYWDEGKWDEEFTLNSILDQPLQDKNRYKVYAKFKSSVYYTVIFDNGDEEIEQQIKYGEQTPLRKNTFTKEDDYVFTGWKSSEQSFTDGQTVFNICEVGETIRLYPQWKIDYGSYTVVFKANGGVGSMPNQIIKRNEMIALNANQFTRQYFNFIGWNTTADRVGSSYGDGESVYNFAEKNGTVTLYAQWEYNDEYAGDEPIVGDTYTVRYVENNGTTATLYEKTMRVGVSERIHCLAYRVPDSYEFVGWNTKEDGTGTMYGNGAYVTDLVEKGQTVVLYAQYKQIGNNSVNGIYYLDEYTDLLLMKNDLSGTYVLIKDIDLPSNLAWSFDYECGTPSSPFNGRFFGNGYRISGTLANNSYQKEVYCGLFGYIGENGWVQDLNLELSIDTWDYSATFARYNKGTIVNCSATGGVYASENEFQSRDLYVGGIVVFNEGTIKNTLSTVFMGGTTLTKNMQMGGICVKNSGQLENCIYLRRNEYNSTVGYKYNDNTSFKLDALICVNEGNVVNNYYFNKIEYAIEKGAYEGEDVEETYESGMLISFYGQGVDKNNINNKSFYIDTLGWSEEIWDFSTLNVDNWKYPNLKKGL